MGIFVNDKHNIQKNDIEILTDVSTGFGADYIQLDQEQIRPFTVPSIGSSSIHNCLTISNGTDLYLVYLKMWNDYGQGWTNGEVHKYKYIYNGGSMGYVLTEIDVDPDDALYAADATIFIHENRVHIIGHVSINAPSQYDPYNIPFGHYVLDEDNKEWVQYSNTSSLGMAQGDEYSAVSYDGDIYLFRYRKTNNELISGCYLYENNGWTQNAYLLPDYDFMYTSIYKCFKAVSYDHHIYLIYKNFSFCRIDIIDKYQIRFSDIKILRDDPVISDDIKSKYGRLGFSVTEFEEDSIENISVFGGKMHAFVVIGTDFLNAPVNMLYLTWNGHAWNVELENIPRRNYWPGSTSSLLVQSGGIRFIKMGDRYVGLIFYSYYVKDYNKTYVAIAESGYIYRVIIIHTQTIPKPDPWWSFGSLPYTLRDGGFIGCEDKIITINSLNYEYGELGIVYNPNADYARINSYTRINDVGINIHDSLIPAVIDPNTDNLYVIGTPYNLVPPYSTEDGVFMYQNERFIRVYDSPYDIRGNTDGASLVISGRFIYALGCNDGYNYFAYLTTEYGLEQWNRMSDGDLEHDPPHKYNLRNAGSISITHNDDSYVFSFGATINDQHDNPINSNGIIRCEGPDIFELQSPMPCDFYGYTQACVYEGRVHIFGYFWDRQTSRIISGIVNHYSTSIEELINDNINWVAESYAPITMHSTVVSYGAPNSEVPEGIAILKDAPECYMRSHDTETKHVFNKICGIWTKVKVPVFDQNGNCHIEEQVKQVKGVWAKGSDNQPKRIYY